MRRNALSTSWRDKTLQWLLPALLLAALVAAWQVAATTGAIADALRLEDFLVPAPSEIAASLWENRSLLADNAWVTLREVLLGFACALAAGLSFAAALHLSETLRRAAYPLLVASQTIPIIVVAPILVVWFGYGIGPKLAIVALICFFPIAVNTLDGLRSVDPDAIKMMRTLDASRLQIFTRVEAPTALPYAFSGAKIAVAVAVIGAVFGEWAGSDSGLGHLMLQDNAQLETARLFAAVVVLSTIAIALFGLLALAERHIVTWR
jgi:NitT/TauT family transport system permease protein/putative hydroxymethylpyrimidine transport system permease protein